MVDIVRFWKKPLLGCLFLVVVFGLCAAQVGPVTAAPMESSTPALQYPHLRGLSDATVQQKVNAQLADQEKSDLETRADCLKQNKLPANDRKEAMETIRVTYLSARFLSLLVRSTDYNCGAYPNIGVPVPMTLDLKTGDAVDWSSLFRTDFLTSTGRSRFQATRLYLSHYKQTDKDCLDAVKAGDSGFDFWLDAKKRVLVMTPDFPHVIQACAEEVELPLTVVAPFVVDRAVADDWLRTR